MSPISAHAVAELRDIAYSPVPAQSINPGVTTRLLQEDLVSLVLLDSPFPNHKKGHKIQHLHVTEAGRALLAGLV
jgi:hypothetical protein